jgi:ribosomal protein S18 acetylase RimI-like enzyme
MASVPIIVLGQEYGYTSPVIIRAAREEDLDFLVWVDLQDEGVTPGYRDGWADADFAAHSESMAGFVWDADRGASIVTAASGERIGAVMWQFRNRLTDSIPHGYVFSEIDPQVFPADGAYCEIFNLWVAPRFRRQGLATALKVSVEEDARLRGVGMIYTHTEEEHHHILAMNAKLGYVEVRRGPIWDEVIRVSLVKHLL